MKICIFIDHFIKRRFKSFTIYYRLVWVQSSNVLQIKPFESHMIYFLNGFVCRIVSHIFFQDMHLKMNFAKNLIAFFKKINYHRTFNVKYNYQLGMHYLQPYPEYFLLRNLLFSLYGLSF